MRIIDKIPEAATEIREISDYIMERRLMEILAKAKADNAKDVENFYSEILLIHQASKHCKTSIIINIIAAITTIASFSPTKLIQFFNVANSVMSQTAKEVLSTVKGVD